LLHPRDPHPFPTRRSSDLGDGFTWESEDMEESQAIAVEAWSKASRIISAGEHHLVILDEVTYPMNWGWIETADVVAAIEERPDQDRKSTRLNSSHVKISYA